MRQATQSSSWWCRSRTRAGSPVGHRDFGSVRRMRRLLGALLIVTVLVACRSDDADDTASTRTTEAVLDEETATSTAAGDDAPLGVDAVVAALGGAGLCADPVPGDPEAESLGSLVPIGVARCTTAQAKSEVTIFVYPSQDDADEVVLAAADLACSVDAGAEFALLVAGGAVVQIDSTEPDGEGFTVAAPDVEALAAAQAVLGGNVRTTEC